MKRRIASILMSTVLLLNTMPLSAAPAAGDPAEGAVLHSENVAQEMIQEEELPTGGFTLPEVVEFSEQEAKKINEAFAQKREEEAISAEAAIYSYASETVDEVFVKGASNYGRNHLSAAQKSFYDDLNTVLLNFVKSGDTVVQSGGNYIAAEGLAYASYGLDYSGAVEAYMAFDYDHPAYYWLDGPGNDPWSGTIYPTVHEEFADPAIREMRDRQIISGVKRIAAKTAQGNTAFEKIVIVVDEIMEAADYAHEIDPDTGKETNIPVSAKWAHSPIGIFDESLAHVVCEGYADTFALMMNYLEIPNVYIAGYGRGKTSWEGHAWNAVSCDGGQTYSYMDITWDDCGHNADTGLAEPSLYKHFGMPKETFESTHQALTSEYSGTLWLYDLPSTLTNDIQHTYYYKAGHYVDSSVTNLSTYLQNAKTNMIGNGRFFAVLANSETAFRNVADALGTDLTYYEVTIGGTYCYLKTILLRNTRYKTPATGLSLTPASNTISESVDELSIPLSCTNAASTDAYAYVTSSDPTVLSIDNPHLRIKSGAKVNATVRGKGTAVITATAFDSGSRATCTMKVENSMYAESISLNETTLTLAAGKDSKKLNATVSPLGASPKVIWSSTNESVATVDDNGVVTPVGGGSCRIIATSKDTPSVSTSCSVTVLTAYSTMRIGCKKDGEDWNDGTQPVFSFRHKESQVVYPDGGIVETGTVEILADGQSTGIEYDVGNYPSLTFTYPIYYYTIKFVDADDTLLQTQFVLEFETPTYSGPELGSEDEYCKVTHTGWSPRISFAYGTATYKATYSTTEKKHHWDEGTVTIEPGCETKGKKTYTCLVNSAHTKTEDIDPIGHKWDNGVVTTPATCESAGTKTFTCENDSSHTYTETIPATGHDWDNGVVTKEPGCETKGVKTYTCKNDSSHTKTEDIDPTGHDWDDGVVTQEPGCITKGKKTFTCRHDDSHTRIEYIDALGHNMTGYQREEPTCTKPGKEAYWKCDRCEKLYLDAEGTTEVSEEALVIPATGHSMTEYAKISATCTKDGREAYCVCENCHKLFSDKTGSKEVTAASLVITATGHDWDEGVITTPATCETDGVKTFTCKNDGTHSYTQKITATGHDWTEWQITKEATEYESGTEERVCQNDASHIETRNIPPLGHTHVMEHITAKPVSCEDDGCNEHYHCKSCGLDYSDEEGTVILNEENVVIRATGHSWDNGVETTPATCEEKGVRTYTCLNDGCGKTETEDIDPIGHLWDGGMETTPATCEEKGVWTYTCLHDGCGKTETEDINPIGHWWDGGVETTPASCEEKGVRTYTCLNDGCGKTKTEDIDPIGHWWDGGMETTHPTCETKGVLTFTCLNSGCGKTKTEDVAPYGHLWGEWFVSQYPTETENGIQTRYCQNDASHIEVKTIPATGSTSVINPEPGQGTFDDWDDDEDDWDEEDWDEAEELLGEIGYEILDEDEETVSFTGPDDLDVSSFSVPASVTVSGRTFAVTKIEDHAFSDCSNLTRVTIGKNVEEIGTGAFSGCSKLKTIIIPAKVKRIRPKAFFGCKNLRKIIIKTTKLTAKTIGSKAFGNTRAKLIIKVPKKCKKAYKRFLKKKGNKNIIIK